MLGIKMTKEELLKNLKGHESQTGSFGWKTGIAGGTAIFLALLPRWFNPLESIIDSDTLMVILLYAFIVPYFYISIKHDKSIDKKYSMYCASCGKRYDPATLPIAVLENQCQKCGARIYDTE